MRWLTLSLDAKSTMVEIAYRWLKVRWSKVQGVVESAGGSRFEVIWCYCAACAAQRPVCFVSVVGTIWYGNVPEWWWWWSALCATDSYNMV